VIPDYTRAHTAPQTPPGRRRQLLAGHDPPKRSLGRWRYLE